MAKSIPDGRYARARGGVRRLVAFLRDRRANIATMTALLIVPFIGAMSLGGELGIWFFTNHSMQIAADSAAIAAATNGDVTNDGGAVPRYAREALAVASNYGFATSSVGVNGNVVTATGTGSIIVVANPVISPSAPSNPNGYTTNSNCPASAPECFQVTISRPVSLYFAGIVGFHGNATLNGGPAETIIATAIATPSGGPGGKAQLCILALGTNIKNTLRVNGGPKDQMNGCSVASNDAADCNGGAINGVNYSFAVSGATNDCGATNDPLKATLTDPYSALAASIPGNTCANATIVANQEASLAKGQTLPAANVLTGSLNGAGGTFEKCGDVQLSGDTTLGAGTVLVIEDGQLDTNGHALTMSGGTVIFTGPTIAGITPSHFPTDNGTPTGRGVLNIDAPASGTWKSMALYQDPNLPAGSGVDITAAGNSPTWNIQGLIYAPESNITISGIVNKSATNACIAFLVNTITINGTGQIINNEPECASEGITLPTINVGPGLALVQ